MLSRIRRIEKSSPKAAKGSTHTCRRCTKYTNHPISFTKLLKHKRGVKGGFMMC